MSRSLLKCVSSSVSLNNTLDLKKSQYSHILEYIENICRSMEIIEGLTFIDVTVKNHTDIIRRKININDTEYFRVTCNFTFNTGETIEKYSFKMCIPKLIDSHYFRIEGVDYFGVVRLNNYKPIHNVTTNSKVILIKTLINNFTIELKDLSKRKNQSFVKVFTKNVNLSLVLTLLADKSIVNMLNYVFGSDNWERLEYTKENLKDIDCSNNIVFADAIINLKVVEPWQEKIITSFNAVKFYFDKMKDQNDDSYIIKQLGKNFSTNTNTFYEKGLVVLRTINRSLDEVTKDILGVETLLELFVLEIKKAENGEFNNYNDVVDKKFKFIENILFPFFKRISDNIYIYLNSRKKRIENVFKVSEDIIIKYVTSSELLQYDDTTSSFDSLVTSKISLTPLEVRKDKIGKKIRQLHESNIGLTDLFSSPNGKSAGLSTFLVPLSGDTYTMCKKYVINKRDI